MNAFLFCSWLQSFTDFLQQNIQFHPFLLHHTVFFIQFGQFDDILNQNDQALGFIIYFPCKMSHIFRRNDAAFHDFCKSGNGSQRCFQFMGNICRKFSSEFFSAFFFRRIKKDDNHTCIFISAENRVGKHFAYSAAQFQPFFSVFSLQCQFHPSAEGFTAIQMKYILTFFHLRNAQQTQNTLIIRKHIAFCIQYQKAFLHVGCDGFKFLFSAVQFRHLPVNLTVLHGNFPKERRQFFIHFRLFRMLQIYLIDRICDQFCRAESNKQRYCTNGDKDQDHGISHGEKYSQDTGCFNRKTHNTAIIQTDSTIPCFFRQSG